MITDDTTYRGRTLGQWVEMAKRSEAEIVRLAGELYDRCSGNDLPAAGAPDLRSANYDSIALNVASDIMAAMYMSENSVQLKAQIQEAVSDALASAAPAGHAEPVAWANVRESDGVVVGLSQHPEDTARWMNPRALVFAAL